LPFSPRLSSLAGAVEFDEIYRRLGIRTVRHTVTEAGADEGQVRIAVMRFEDLLVVAELCPQLHPIVMILGTLGKKRVEGTKELRHQIVPILKTQRQTLAEVACRGM